MASEELNTLIAQLQEQPARDLELPQLRETFEQMAAPVEYPADYTPVEDGSVRGEWIVASEAATDRTILYLHGGGYAIGSIHTHRDLMVRLSRDARARVLALDYRLAPENPFPAAVEDATAAYRWLLDQGRSPKQIVVAGDSAGGGLTLATLVKLRDEGVPLPAAAVCISPWTDLEGTGASVTEKADVDPMVQKEGLDRMAKAYLGGADPRNPLASPLHADLSGLPPMLIQVGDREILLDDATRLAAKAREAGVDVTLEVWDGMIHVWHFFAGLVPEGREAVAKIAEWIDRRL